MWWRLFWSIVVVVFAVGLGSVMPGPGGPAAAVLLAVVALAVVWDR